MSDMKSMNRRIMLLVNRGDLTMVNDTGGRQYIQFNALKGEVKDRVERMQQYGFTSNPRPGAKVLFLSVGGNRDHPIAICVDDSKYRPSLETGEVAIFTDEGDTVILKRGRTIEVTTVNLVVNATEKMRVNAPLLEVTGEIKDNCDGDGLTMKQMRTRYNSHTHGGGAGPNPQMVS